MNKHGTVVFALAGCIGFGTACSEPPAPPANGSFKDGTRLKAVYQRIEGAPSVLLNWYDTLLAVDCTFVDLGRPDRRLFCFPSDPAGADVRSLFAVATNLFEDSACTQPIVNAPFAPCTTRFFAREPELGEGCGAPVHLYKLGPALPFEPNGLYSTVNDGPCQPAAAADLDAYRELHAVGEEIPLDTLVSGTYQHDAGAGRIVPLRFVGSDGSIQGEAWNNLGPAGGGGEAWDNERDEMVSTLRPGDRWLPSAHFATGLFADAACSVATAVGPACRVDAKEAFTYASDACNGPTPTNVFELGAPVADQASVYTAWPDNTCHLYNSGAGSPIVNPLLAAYEIGAPVPVTAFAAAQEVRTGTGQIKIVQVGTADGPAVISVGFFDSAHGTACTFQRNLQSADGVVRCLPAANDPDFYADTACSVPLVLGGSPESCSGPQPPAFASITENVPMNSACYMPVYRQHIFAVGAAYTGEVYSKLGPNDCLDLGSANIVGPLYTTGPEIPAAEFAALDYVRPN